MIELKVGQRESEGLDPVISCHLYAWEEPQKHVTCVARTKRDVMPKPGPETLVYAAIHYRTHVP